MPSSGTVLSSAIGPKSLLHLPRTQASPDSHCVDRLHVAPERPASSEQLHNAHTAHSTSERKTITFKANRSQAARSSLPR
jgi:hypothetical protein